MSKAETTIPKAAIFGLSGLSVSAAERRLFAAADPLGFILFARNIDSPDQVRAVVASLREIVGRPDAPVLIDQEGGRVARLGPPHWRVAPPAAVFGAMADRDPDAAGRAVRLNARLLAAELHDLGIDVDCAPVLDVPAAGSHDIVGDRAFSSDPDLVARLGRAAIEGFLEGGVVPVVKHIPGHGRAEVDSHHALPVVAAGPDELRKTDFRPFAALSDAPWAMTAHVVYRAIDAAHPATTSETVIADVVRGEIDFRGLLVSDDLSMEALSGSLGERAAAALAAGCDVALHCNGDLAEMEEVSAAAGPMTEAAVERQERARAMRRRPEAVDLSQLVAQLESLIGPTQFGRRN